MASNGRLAASELSPIPGGRLETGAAAAWNAPHGPADSGLLPSGENGTYRELGHEGDYPPPEYGTQWYFWGAYQAGVGNLAAQPGFSVHGFGKAIDLAAEWMRSWIDDHGRKFGWAKTEAFSEWWHVNFVGGVSFPTFKVLKHGMRGKRVVWYTRRLAYIHPAEKNHGYLRRNFWKYKDAVVNGVENFQRDHDLQVDGKIGEDTAHAISAVFHRQYVARKGKRKRLLRDVARGRK
jgi:hypothetical protein